MLDNVNEKDLIQTLTKLTNEYAAQGVDFGDKQKFVLDLANKLINDPSITVTAKDLVDEKSLKIACMTDLCKMKDPNFKFDHTAGFKLTELANKEDKEEFTSFLKDLSKELIKLKPGYKANRENNEEYDFHVENDLEKMFDKLDKSLKDSKENDEGNTKSQEFAAAAKDVTIDHLGDQLASLYGIDIRSPGKVSGPKAAVLGNPLEFQDLESDPSDPNFMATDDRVDFGDDPLQKKFNIILTAVANDAEGLDVNGAMEGLGLIPSSTPSLKPPGANGGS